MTPEHELELKRVDALIQIIGALDKMTARLFSKLAVTPLEELEAQCLVLFNQVKDEYNLRKEAKESLEQNLHTLGCLMRFRDDLIMNVPNAKQCWDKSADIRNLLKDIGECNFTFHIVKLD